MNSKWFQLIDLHDNYKDMDAAPCFRSYLLTILKTCFCILSIFDSVDFSKLSSDWQSSKLSSPIGFNHDKESRFAQPQGCIYLMTSTTWHFGVHNLPLHYDVNYVLFIIPLTQGIVDWSSLMLLSVLLWLHYLLYL